MNREEQLRIKALHPNDPEVFIKGYLKGRVQPTRGVGDLYLKSKEFNIKALGKTQLQPGTVRCKRFEPPYVTVLPQVVSHSIRQEDHFLLLASDGLWGEVSSEEAVRIAQGALSAGDDPARELAAYAVAQSALSEGYPLEVVLRMPPGKIRRRLHDDITVVVVVLPKGDDVETWHVAKVDSAAAEIVLQPALPKRATAKDNELPIGGLFASESGGQLAEVGGEGERYRIPRAWLPEGVNAGETLCSRPQQKSLESAKVRLWKKEVPG